MSLRLLSCTLLALALSTSACSSDESDSSAPPARATPVASAPPSDGGSYPGTAEVIAAMVGRGLPCDEPMDGSYPGVTEAQSCILDGAEDVVVLRFATPAEKQEYVSTKEELAHAVLGQDWAVQTVLPQTAERIAGVLGGQLALGATS